MDMYTVRIIFLLVRNRFYIFSFITMNYICLWFASLLFHDDGWVGAPWSMAANGRGKCPGKRSDHAWKRRNTRPAETASYCWWACGGSDSRRTPIRPDRTGFADIENKFWSDRTGLTIALLRKTKCHRRRPPLYFSQNTVKTYYCNFKYRPWRKRLKDESRKYENI